jgi:3-methyladenine DNA glycosylase AlkD
MYIDNWALSDGLSSLLAEILEENPQYFARFKKWNKSGNPWLRRQSLVGIYYYARQRGKIYPPKEVLLLVKNLLEDDHFYIQKSVGWTLREIDRIDSSLQRSFVKKHLSRISGVAWYAASELYPAEMKRKLVIMRRRFRAC